VGEVGALVSAKATFVCLVSGDDDAMIRVRAFLTPSRSDAKFQHILSTPRSTHKDSWHDGRSREHQEMILPRE